MNWRKESKVLALCGGVGGAKLALGLTKILAPQQLTIVVNTGDDFEHFGLTVCPDLDTVTYTLAGLKFQADEARPLVLIRGLEFQSEPASASQLLRPPGEDLFL